MVKQLITENEQLKEIISKMGAGISQARSDSWTEVTPETLHDPTPQTPRRSDSKKGGSLRFTPGGTQVPLSSPPRTDEDDVPSAPPLPPPFPTWGLDQYEKVAMGGHHGPCQRALGKTWAPTGPRNGVRDWTIFLGQESMVQEWYLRQALDDCSEAP